MTTVDIRVVQGLGGDLLLWEGDGSGAVHVQCVSPDQVVALLLPLLTDPAAVPIEDAQACAQCGMPRKEGAKFCTNCGAALA